jgi:predicted TIM-barrel fold metal-dependent hydrolase
MLIVDAQVHIWSQGTPSGQHRQISSYTAEDCLKEMGEGGVAAAVLHPPRWDPNDVEFAAEAAHQYPNRLRKKSRFWKNGHETGSQREPWSN